MKKVSEILKEEREKKGYSYEQVEKITKIKIKFLKSIEEGRFNELPSESYALGFIKNYADFLGLPKNKVAALFRREYEMLLTNHSDKFHDGISRKFNKKSYSKQERSEILPGFRKKPYKFKSSSFFSSRNLFIVILFLVFLAYIFFQYNSLIFPPQLEITNPKNNEVIKETVVQINGKTDPYATVNVNGEETYVNIDGKFKKSIYVFSGTKKITVVAKNRFGKETKEEIDINVK